jgi:hypothetical protein
MADRTGWQGDLLLPSARVTIMLISSDDIVTNLRTGTKGPNYMFKVARDQLERLGNRKVQNLETSIWMEMNEDSRQKMVQHIKSKFRLDGSSRR